MLSKLSPFSFSKFWIFQPTFVPVDVLPSLSASVGSFLCLPLNEILAVLWERRKRQKVGLVFGTNWKISFQ